MEAASIGLPIIAMDVGGTREIITQGETGMLVESGSTRQLEERLHELLANAELRGKLGRTDRIFVEQKFNWDRIAHDWINLIECIK